MEALIISEKRKEQMCHSNVVVKERRNFYFKDETTFNRTSYFTVWRISDNIN